MTYFKENKPLSAKAEKTFNKIIKHAKKELSLNGYSNTSIHTIAAKAKVSVGCIYKYFDNKDDLYNYIITNEQFNIRQHLDSRISVCKTRKEKEKEGLRAWLCYVRENPGVYRLIWETLFIDKKAFDNYYNTFAQSYEKALSKDSDQLTDEDYKNIAYMLIGISNFLGVRIIANEEKLSDEEIDKMVETADRILSNGLFK